MLSGFYHNSLSSSNSGSANTSMEDWSDDSDEEIDQYEQPDEMQIAQEWLVSEFRLEAPVATA